jgi:pseudomonalisin
VGGTEFNDTGNPSQYWGSNDGNLGSALSYIPEGGWNEPQDQNSNFQASSSGGGVSLFIPTPSWQTGTGVPSAKTGRYTPDIAFTSAGHDGYFGCFAASGASCVPDGSGNYSFEYSYGTSAASPDMAGITALLDQQMAGAQGSLNPQLYQLAASSPAAFHDATVDSSGVSPCSVNTPSICNNSIPSPSALTGGQAGFLLTTGFDEVTGLGSLDVSVFITDYAAATSPNPGFTISGTAVAITAGATTGNTSAITVTPTNAFTGTVTFTCAVTTAPAGATSPVTCTPPSSADVTGTTAVTTTTPLTIASTSTTTGGAYAVTVTGTSGNLVETGVVAVTVTAVNPNATFTMTITAASPALSLPAEPL